MTLSLITIGKDKKVTEVVTKSVKGIAKEIIFIKDTAKGGCKNFSVLRNKGIAKATSDWILMLDSDEVLSQEAIRAIPTLIKDKNIDGYWFRRRWYWDTTHYLKHGLFYPDYQLRLFRNKPEYRYIHRVHEELTIPKEKTKHVAFDIYHYNSGQKQLRAYTKLAALDFKDLEKPKVWYLWKAIYSFIDMFFVAFIRGKGILDGWIGVKAHFFFAQSISRAYWEAIW